jgi:mannonate dehydratase
MFVVTKELVRQKYPRLIDPEHPRGLDVDRDLTTAPPQHAGGGGCVSFVYNVGCAKAMLQAALISHEGDRSVTP